jgi:hypothetical protein
LSGGPDFNRGALYVNQTGSSGHVSFLVAGAQQVSGQVAKAKFFAGIDASRSGINAGGVLENLTGEMLVNKMAELDVVIGKDRSCGEEKTQGDS